VVFSPPPRYEDLSPLGDDRGYFDEREGSGQDGRDESEREVEDDEDEDEEVEEEEVEVEEEVEEVEEEEVEAEEEEVEEEEEEEEEEKYDDEGGLDSEVVRAVLGDTGENSGGRRWMDRRAPRERDEVEITEEADIEEDETGHDAHPSERRFSLNGEGTNDQGQVSDIHVTPETSGSVTPRNVAEQRSPPERRLPPSRPTLLSHTIHWISDRGISSHGSYDQCFSEDPRRVVSRAHEIFPDHESGEFFDGEDLCDDVYGLSVVSMAGLEDLTFDGR
jgi:hypothetical protein